MWKKKKRKKKKKKKKKRIEKASCDNCIKDAVLTLYKQEGCYYNLIKIQNKPFSYILSLYLSHSHSVLLLSHKSSLFS